jgi:TonB family protein
VRVVVQCLIDSEGLPQNPQLIQSSGEFTMVLSALETLGRWRIKPATRDGVAVPVLYSLAVNFRAR